MIPVIQSQGFFSIFRWTIFGFLIRNFAIEYISFSKLKECSNRFDDWHSDVWLFFFKLFAREKSHRKEAKTSKNFVQWERFLLYSRCVVLIWWMSATDSALLKLLKPSAFITVHKLWLFNKPSMYNYELWTMHNEI